MSNSVRRFCQLNFDKEFINESLKEYLLTWNYYSEQKHINANITKGAIADNDLIASDIGFSSPGKGSSFNISDVFLNSSIEYAFFASIS